MVDPSPDPGGLYDELVTSIEAIVWEADADPLAFTFVSDQAEAMLGFPARCWLASPSFWTEHIHPDDRERVVQECSAAVAGGRSHTLEYRFVAADGSIVWLRDAVRVLLDEGERPARLRGVMVDVTEQKALVDRLAASERRYRSLIGSIHAAVWVLGADDEASYVSPQMAAMLGYSEVEMLGERPTSFVIGTVVDEMRAELAGRKRGDAGRYEIQLRHRDGHPVPVLISASPLLDDRGDYAGSMGLCYDLTDRDQEREFTEAVLSSVVEGVYLVDPAGRLVSMNGAAERLLGYTSAELVGTTIHDVIHHEDVDGRRVAAEDCPLLDVRRLGAEVRVEDGFYIRKDGSRLPVSLSSSPVVAADGRRAAVVVFRDISEQKATQQEVHTQLGDLAWLERINDALANDRFVLYGQPIITLAGGGLMSTELLLRMRGEQGEIIPPGAFLPAAERYGLILEIDRWVIQQAAQHAARGHRVQVNVSACSIADAGLVDYITQAILAAGARPELLIFELTETAFMEDEARGLEFGRGLAALGCELALDDFGTGYGTFTYLKKLDLSYLKIDREFITDLVSSPASRHVARAVVGLARDFGLQTIAEGVEDQETLDLLRDFGVDHAQGYLIGRPAPLDLNPSEAPPVLDAMAELALIRRALDEDSFIERTRPIVDIHTRTAVKHELTLDLPTGDGQTLPPAGYGATVRDLGLSTEIDDLTLRRALRLARYGDAVAIGVSAESFADPDLARRFEQTIIDARVDTALLTFELPKHGVTANEAGASAFVNRLHGLGCAITIDRFSLGEADPGFLRRHRVDCIKIDAGCVEGLTAESPDVQLLRALVDLAQTLGMRTAADGVGDATVLEFLEDLGLDEVQGSLFAADASGPPSRVPAPVATHAEGRP